MTEFIDTTVPLEARQYSVACAAGRGKWSMEFALSRAVIAPSAAPPASFGLSVERRNLDGAKIEVADWPYDKEVSFLFEVNSDKTKPQPSDGGEAVPAPQR